MDFENSQSYQNNTNSLNNQMGKTSPSSQGYQSNQMGKTSPSSQGYQSNQMGQSNQVNMNMGNRKMHDQCEKMMNYHSLFVAKDGTKFDGIIQRVEPDYVVILVAEDVVSDDEDDLLDKKTRQYGYGNPRRFRRFVPRPYPYNNIGRVGLLPYPYYVPPYPYAGGPYPFL